MRHQFLIAHLFDFFAEQERLQFQSLPFTLLQTHRHSILRRKERFGKNFLHLHFASAKLEHLPHLPRKVLVRNRNLLPKDLGVNQNHHNPTQIIPGFLEIQKNSALRLLPTARRPLRYLNPHLPQSTRLQLKQHLSGSSNAGLGTTSRWTACIQTPLQR